jgi:hypothetical protein
MYLYPFRNSSFPFFVDSLKTWLVAVLIINSMHVLVVAIAISPASVNSVVLLIMVHLLLFLLLILYNKLF